MTTSIMFVTYNRVDFTKRMLDKFFQNTTSPYRLIIVDNGSTDETRDLLGGLHVSQDLPHCKSIDIQYNQKNMGIAAGRNQGLAIAKNHQAKYLSTLDNDIELPPHWLEDCLDIIQANPNFAIGINMEPTDYPLQTINGKTFQVKPAGNLGTACTVFSRLLHASIGYFTTEMGLYAHEDADFFFRARMAGYRMGYLQEKGIHFGEGPEDTGPYREFKNQCSKDNLAKFQLNCRLYMSKQKSYFIPFCQ